MVADSVLKTEDKFDLTGDNDNDSGAVLTQKEIHPLALEGAKRLISQHSAQTPVIIKSWGTPDVVHANIRQSLIDFGYEIGMAEDMAEKLVEHAEVHSETSRVKYGANIIALKIEVSKEKPNAQFETGALESQRIDGLTNQAQIAGATTVAVGFSTSGTTTTALRDSVGEIMQAMAGASQAVWIDFEAPDKSELQGMANDAALSAMAQIAGGGLAPEQVAELLAEIQSYNDMGLLAPEMLNALQNMNQIQVQAMEGNFDGIKELSQSIIEDLSTALESGDVSPEMIATAIDALQAISDTHGLKTVIDMKGLMELTQDVQVVQLAEKLGVIAEGLEGADRTTLEELIEQLSELGNTELLSHLDTIQEHLESVGIEGAELTAITADIDSLKELVTQNLPLDQKLEVLAEMGAQNLMDLLQELNGLDDLPPELAELLEQLDVENLTIEELKEALAGNGDPALVEAVQNVVITLQNPEIQAALPQVALNQVNQFLATQSALVEAVTAKAIVSELSSAIIDLNSTSPEAVKIQEVIDRLEAGESIDTIDPAIIEAVADKLDSSVAAKLNTAAQTLQTATAENITIGADTRIELNNLIQSGDLDASLTSRLKQVVETGDLNTAVSAIGLATYGTDAVPTTVDFSASAVSQQVNAIIENNADSSIPTTPTTENLQTATDVIQKLDSNTPPTISEIVEAVQRLNTVEGISPVEIVQINTIKEKLISSLPSQAQTEQATALTQGHKAPNIKPSDNPQRFENKTVESIQKENEVEGKSKLEEKEPQKSEPTNKQEPSSETKEAEFQKLKEPAKEPENRSETQETSKTETPKTAEPPKVSEAFTTTADVKVNAEAGKADRQAAREVAKARKQFKKAKGQENKGCPPGCSCAKEANSAAGGRVSTKAKVTTSVNDNTKDTTYTHSSSYKPN